VPALIGALRLVWCSVGVNRANNGNFLPRDMSGHQSTIKHALPINQQDDDAVASASAQAVH
jgi:hypothetical protein